MTSFCCALTYRQTRDNPAEYCDNDVPNVGDLCPAHEEDDRSDDAYERFREDQRKES